MFSTGLKTMYVQMIFSSFLFLSVQFGFLNLCWASDQDQSLFKAVQAHRISKVRQLLKKGINVNKRDEIGQTALMQACAKGYKDIVELLLNNGADINAKDNVGGTALMYAGMGGHEEVAILLLDNGAKLETSDIMKNTALIRVVARGHKDIAKLFLERGADVNKKGAYGMTPLMWAVSQTDIALVKLLLDFGANVNATARGGVTALMIAVGPVCIEEKGYYGSTASVLLEGGDADVVKLLLDNGADVNAKDVHGNTALYYAVQKGDDKIKSLLLSYGAR